MLRRPVGDDGKTFRDSVDQTLDLSRRERGDEGRGGGGGEREEKRSEWCPGRARGRGVKGAGKRKSRRDSDALSSLDGDDGDDVDDDNMTTTTTMRL